MPETTTIDLSVVLQSLTVAVLGAAVSAGLKRLNAIRDHLATINGRVGRMETWQAEHERHDEILFEDLRGRVTSIEQHEWRRGRE